jgi:hypothetical protein
MPSSRGKITSANLIAMSWILPLVERGDGEEDEGDDDDGDDDSDDDDADIAGAAWTSSCTIKVAGLQPKLMVIRYSCCNSNAGLTENNMQV